ncbi:hypothetical protein [Actinacidiphila sp. bgisy160]|uniref:hypothetical protein n=1 Tax=Actinacidiphila sp. bgisy160 TaxID=3413796 RepID=UPI003D72D109
MKRTSGIRRLVTLTAVTTLAAGGTLLPATAFAATPGQAPAHPVTAKATGHGGWGGGHGGDWGGRGHGDGWGGGSDWNHDKGPGGNGNGGIIIVVGDNNSTNVNNGTINNGVIAD